jgi:hypothetical protein
METEKVILNVFVIFFAVIYVTTMAYVALWTFWNILPKREKRTENYEIATLGKKELKAMRKALSLEFNRLDESAKLYLVVAMSLYILFFLSIAYFDYLSGVLGMLAAKLLLGLVAFFAAAASAMVLISLVRLDRLLRRVCRIGHKQIA